MIGRLPTELNIDGTDMAIRSDFRVALTIFQAFNDPDLTEQEQTLVMLDCLYEDFYLISEENIATALKMAVWFLDGGSELERKGDGLQKKVMDWEQDEQLIFSAVNKIAGFETRAKEYLHWWTFLGFFNEIGDGLLTTIINIRTKKSNGKKLDKTEQEFYKKNKSMIELKRKYSAEVQEEMDKINQLLNS